MRRQPMPERVLATVLFTDIVGSTERAAAIGDRRWQELVARHHRIVRSELKRFRGREIDTAGDGFFAIFDRPANAIACALAIVASVAALGLQVRAGLHAGEVEPSGRKVGGIAVHTAARVVGQAQADEVLVTATVRELVAGSDFEFADRGMAALKGVPGEWHLFAVAQSAHPADASTGIEAPAANQTRLGVSPLLGAAALVGVLALGAGAAVLLPRLLAEPAKPIVPGVDSVARIPAGAEAFDLALDVGSQPKGLAAGGGAIWVLNFDDQTLSRIDPATRKVVATKAVGGPPTGLTYGADAVWVTTGFTTGQEGSVVRFNARSNQADHPLIAIGNGAQAIAFGLGALWVVNPIDGEVLKIDPSTNSIVKRIQVGASPGAIGVGAGSVWVASTLDNQILRIDPTTYATGAPIQLRAAPTAIAVTEDAVWVTSDTGDTVTRIDPESGTLIKDIGVGDGPNGVAVTNDAVWVAVGREGKVVRIDPKTDLVVATSTVEGSPDSLVVDDSGAVWVSVHAQ
jgi:YVTN family beta-propeller protein